MDHRSLKSGSCNSGGKNPVPPSPAAGPGRPRPRPRRRARRRTLAAAASARRCCLGIRQAAWRGRARGSKRRVQWKDSHGKKLVEVLEFQPSDSSDSDDEYLDTCICSVM